MLLSKKMKFIKLFFFSFFLIITFSELAFSYDRFEVSVINDKDLGFYIYSSKNLTGNLYYKYDYEYSYKKCNFTKLNSEKYGCEINVGYSNFSNFLYYIIEINGRNITQKNNVFYLNNSEDSFSENLINNFLNNTPSSISLKCSFINDSYDCYFVQDWSFEILNLIDLYMLEKNNTYLSYIDSFINNSFLDSCNYEDENFNCYRSNLDNYNISGAYKNGLLGFTFASLNQLISNKSYINISYNYLSSSSELCDPYNFDFTCEDNSNGILGDDFAYYIKGYLKYYEQTGDERMFNISKQIGDYVINNNYFDSPLILNSFLDLYRYTGNRTYYNIVENNINFYNKKCINNPCTVEDYSYLLQLYSNIKFLTSDYLRYNFYSQNLIYKLYSNFTGSCNFNDYKCSNAYEQNLVLNGLLETFKSIKNTKNVLFRFPRSLTKKPILLENLNYTINIEGYVDNLSLLTEEGIFQINFKPFNFSNFMISTFNLSSEKSYDIRFLYEIDNFTYYYPSNGSLKLIISSLDNENLNLFKEVSNLSLRNPSYFCDPFGGLDYKEDFQCKYEHFQAPLISSFSLISSIDNTYEDFYKNFLPKISVKIEDNFYYGTCDPQNNDFYCEKFNSNYASVIQDYAVPGSYRSSEMINSLYDSLIYENKFDFNLTYTLLMSYIYGSNSDCDIFKGDFFCEDEVSQGKMLGGIYNSYLATGNDFFYKTLINFTNFSLSNNLYNTTFFIKNLWDVYSLTNISDFYNYSNNLTYSFSNNCIGGTCEVNDKVSTIELFLNALKNTNENYFSIFLDNSLVGGGDTVCNSFLFFTEYKDTGSKPSETYLDCNFPYEIGLNSKIFSELYYNYFDPVERLFKVNLSFGDNVFNNSINYSDSFIVSCNVNNFQNDSLRKVNLYLITVFSVENYSFPNNLNISNLTSDNKIFQIENFPENSSYTFNWTLKADKGGKKNIICKIGENASSNFLISDNIGLITNLSVNNLKSHVVEDKSYYLYEINISNIPFLIENVSLKFVTHNLNINSFEVFNSYNKEERKDIPFKYNKTTNVLRFDEINKNETRIIKVNATILNSGYSNFDLFLTTLYQGYNNISSDFIYAVPKDSFFTDIQRSGGVKIYTTESFYIDYILKNDVSTNNYNYTMEDVSISLYNVDLLNLDHVEILNGTPFYYDNKNVFFKNIYYNDSIIIRWYFNETGHSRDVDVEFVANSLNGFYKKDVENIVISEVTSSGSSSTVSIISSSGGSSGSRRRSSSSFTNYNTIKKIESVNNVTNITFLNYNETLFNNTFKNNYSNLCDKDLEFYFNEKDVQKFFRNNKVLLMKIFENYFNNTRREYVQKMTKILFKNNIFKSEYIDLFNNELNKNFNLEVFYGKNFNFSLSNLDCLKVRSKLNLTHNTYFIRNFCYKLNQIGLIIEDENVILESEDFQENNVKILILKNNENDKNFLDSRKIKKEYCLNKNSISSFFTIDDYYLEKLMVNTLKKTLKIIEEENKIVLNYNLSDNFYSKNLEGIDLGKDITAKRMLLKSFNVDDGESDDLKVFKPFIICSFIFSLFMLIFSFFVIVFYKYRKVEENMYYLLKLIEKNIDENNKEKAILNLNKFYNKYFKYFGKKKFYVYFIKDLNDFYLEYNNLNQRLRKFYK